MNMASLQRIQFHVNKVIRQISRLSNSPTSSTRRCYSSELSDVHVVDMRTDCLTQPTSAMIQAMTRGTLGDDVFNEDPTVHELQNKMAGMFGMEAALFVPSGTMGNLISVLAHCDKRGLEVLFGHMAHLVMAEQGGVSQLGGLMARTMQNKPDGTFDLDELESYIRPKDDPHQPFTGLVTVENTHGICGGKSIPLDFLAKLRAKTNDLGLPVHMDGARVMNAAVSQNVEVGEILQHVDSVSLCLSKCIGAPIGSVIGGSAELIAKAVRLRKVLGGGWRQPGPLAAAALVALSDHRQRIAQDHKHAQMFAQGVMEKHKNMVHIDVEGVHTNIVLVQLLKPGLTADQFCQRLKMVTEEEKAHSVPQIILKVRPARMSHTKIRCYLHSSVTTEDVSKALHKWHYVMEEFS